MLFLTSDNDFAGDEQDITLEVRDCLSCTLFVLALRPCIVAYDSL